MQAGGVTQAERSRRRITRSLLGLMRNDGEFHEITILQLCQEAGLSRRTFYRHFRTKEDVLRGLLDEMRREFVERYDIAGKSLEEEIHCSFDYFDRQRNLLELLYRHHLFYLVKDMLEDYMRGACTQEHALMLGQPDMERYFDSYFAGSFSATLELWVRSGFDKTPDALSAFTCSLHAGTVGDPRI